MATGEGAMRTAERDAVAMNVSSEALGGAPTGSFRMPKEVVKIFLPLVLAIVAIGAYTATQDSTFVSGSNIQGILSESSTLGILALGQTLLLIAGELDLSVGSAVSLYGVLAAKLLLPPAIPTWAIIVVVIAIGAAVGLFWGVLVTYVRVPAFILTLGGLSLLSSAALVIANSTPIPINSSFNVLANDSWFGVRTPTVIFVLLALFCWLGLRYTRYGRHVFSVGANEQAAYLSGVPTRAVKLAVFVLNGALVAPAALILMARLGAGDPQMGSGLELQAVAAAVLGGATLLGGKGSIVGTVLAVVLLGVISSALIFLNITGTYQGAVYGGVLVIAVTLSALSDRRSDERLWQALRRGLTALLRRPGNLTGGRRSSDAGDSLSAGARPRNDEGTG